MMSDICFEKETPYERAIFDLVDSGQARDDTVAEWARLLRERATPEPAPCQGERCPGCTWCTNAF